jgi:hypothetical protein
VGLTLVMLTAVGRLARWGTALVLGRDASAFPDLDAVLARARGARRW